MSDEAFLITQLRDGDETAYRHLFDHEYVIMCRFANSIIHDYVAAESIANDVIFNIWTNRKSLNITKSLRSYLLTAVRNRCLNELKARMRRISSLSDDIEEKSETDLLDTIFHDEEQPVSILIGKELEEEIARCLAKMPEECRIVFEKSRFEGKKNKEIADELGISVNTVKYHIKNALAFMRENLDGYLKWTIFALFYY